MPMTPAPTTAMRPGKLLEPTTSSVLRMSLAVGPVTRRVGRMGADRDQDVVGGERAAGPCRADHQRVRSRRTRPRPDRSATSLRRSWFSTTSVSRVITMSMPEKSCWQVGRASSLAHG